MKTVILNGSPRKNWNTAQILKEAQRGAESAGDEVSYVDLYSLDYNGCRGCMACKRKGIAEPFKCRFKDGLTPVLESILQADRLIAGAPIYFDNVPGGFHSLVERISFPALSYNDYTSTFPGKVDIDMFFTMNANEKRWEQVTKARVSSSLEPLHLLRGELRMFPVFNTLQVKDYSKYEMASFSEEDKRAARETEFPKALEHAFKAGARTDR